MSSPTALVRRALAIVSLSGCAGTALPAEVDAGPDGACEPPPTASAPIVDPGPGIGAIDRSPDPSCAASFLAGITGHVEDPSGVPIAGARVQPCIVVASSGALLCLVPPTTDDAGDFAIPIELPEARCAEHVTLRVLAPGRALATTYCEPALAPEDGVLALAEPLVLFPVERPVCLPARAEASAPREVVLADGLVLDGLRPDRVSRYEQLAASRVEIGAHCVGRGGPGAFEGVYALAPETDLAPDDDPVAVRIPNSTHLAPGASVELWVLGGIATPLPGVPGETIAEGTWARFGTATVSGDATTIASDPGVSLSALTWLAYR